MTLTLFSAGFCLLVFILYYLLPRKTRLPLLCAASLLYAFLLDLRAGLAVVITIDLFYLAGLAVVQFRTRNDHTKARLTAGLSIALSLLILAAMKYLPMVSLLQAREDTLLSRLFIPVGFSFYLFQAISFLVELTRGSIELPGPIGFALYLSWFPRFVSGPIERPGVFLEQAAKAAGLRLRDNQDLREALFAILYGVFMKLVIADRLGIYADTIMDTPEAFSSAWILIGILMYTFQIYCDFAGYSAAASGFSLLFGIRLTENFAAPYLSGNITDFWRRWHISLSSWLRDYLYIPLGGNRKGSLRRILNTMIVFIVCGMWHGAGLCFIIWGALHGLYSAIDQGLRRLPARLSGLLRGGMIGRILTFTAVTFAWIFFRSPNAGHAVKLLHLLFTVGPRWHSFPYEMEALGINTVEYTLLFALILFVLLTDAFIFAKKRSFGQLAAGLPLFVRCLIIYLMVTAIIIFGIYGIAYTGGRLIYMQF